MSCPRSNLTVDLCAGSKCRKKGAKKLLKNAHRVLEKLGQNTPMVITHSCQGQCKQGPIFSIDRGAWSIKASPGDLRRALRARGRKLRKSA